jgi:hypothetical protein
VALSFDSRTAERARLRGREAPAHSNNRILAPHRSSRTRCLVLRCGAPKLRSGSSPASSHDRRLVTIQIRMARSKIVLFSFFHLGLRRLLELIVRVRHGDADKDLGILVLRHQVHILERQIHGRVDCRPADRAIWPRSASCFPATAGGFSWSHPTHWSVGPARQQLESSVVGVGNVRPVAPACPLTWLHPSSAWEGESQLGLCAYPGRVEKARDPSIGHLSPARAPEPWSWARSHAGTLVERVPVGPGQRHPGH